MPTLPANSLRPLFLAFWAPPVIRPQAMLLQKMLPEWLRQGVTPVLVTYETEGEWNAGVERVTLPHFIPRGIFRFPYLNFFAQYFYWRKCSRILASVAKKEHVNVIYSFANPIESNIIGAMVARRTGLPYVAHFSDPWVSGLRDYSWLGLWKIKRLERYVIEAATIVTATDEPMKEYIMKPHVSQLQKKFAVINHCFDPADYPSGVERPKAFADKFIISHIGSFYAKKRSPDPLFAGIVSFLQKHPDFRTKIIVELIGGVNDYGGYSEAQLHAAIESYALSDVVRVVPPVSYKESLVRMRVADCLVVIEFAVSYFVAMKVFDYAGADRPIVALAPHGSSTETFVTKLGYHSFAYEESDGLGKYFFDLIEGNITPKPDKIYRKTFEVASTTKELIGLMEQAILTKNSGNIEKK